MSSNPFDFMPYGYQDEDEYDFLGSRFTDNPYYQEDTPFSTKIKTPEEIQQESILSRAKNYIFPKGFLSNLFSESPSLNDLGTLAGTPKRALIDTPVSMLSNQREIRPAQDILADALFPKTPSAPIVPETLQNLLPLVPGGVALSAYDTLQRAKNTGLQPISSAAEAGERVGRATTRGVGGLALDPMMFAGFGLEGIPGKALAAGFGIPAVQSGYEGLKTAAEKASEGNWLDAIEPGIEGVLNTGMGLFGLKHAGSDIPLGKGYTTSSPINLEPSRFRNGPISEAPTPAFGSLMAEGGGGLPLKDSFVGSLVDTGEVLSRPQEPFRTIAEHGTSYPGWFDRGETPEVSPSGAYGKGLYTSQVVNEAPGYSRIRGAGDRVERVRDKMIEAPYDPTTMRGDVSAEKPLFLDETAPPDLRMKAMVELNKARKGESYSPEALDSMKATILDPNSNAHTVAEVGSQLLRDNIPIEERSSYKGDPYSDLIQSAGYDLWATGERGMPAQEMVIPDPRRQFKIGDSYKSGPGTKAREILTSKNVGEELGPQNQSLENPSVRISEPPPVQGKPIELGDIIESVAKDLGWKEIGPTSKMMGEGPINPSVGISLGPNTGPLKKLLAKYSDLFDTSKPYDRPTNLRELDDFNKTISDIYGSNWVNDPKVPVKLRAAYNRLIESANRYNENPPLDIESQSVELSQDPDIRRLQEEALARPVTKGENIPPSKPIEPAGEVVPGEGKEKSKSWMVFLDDGSKHVIKGMNLEDAQTKAENILSSFGSDKKVVDIKEKLGSLETAASIPASERDIKGIDKIIKEQEKEIFKTKSQEEKAHEKELKSQLGVEGQYSKQVERTKTEAEKIHEKELKAQLKVEQSFSKQKEKEANKQDSYQVTLSDGSKHYVRSTSESAAKEYAEQLLSQGNSELTVSKVVKRKSSLEMKAQGEIKEQYPGTRWQDNPIVKLANSIKSIVYGGDVGHLLRQGKQMNIDLLMSKHIGKVFEQVPVLFKAAKSEKFFTDFHAKLAANPNIKVLVEKFGLDMPGLGHGLKEEAFHEAGLAEQIPLVGKYYAKPSERAYTAGLNFLRAAEANKLVEAAKSEGKTPDNSPETYRGIARAINIISQRGDFSPKTSKILADSSFLFGAPRAKASRVQNLVELFRGGESGAVVRKTAVKMLVFNVGMMGLLKAARPNGEIVDDPKRTDFGKFRDGDITVDPWAGLGTTVRTMIQATNSSAKSPHTGKEYEVASLSPAVKEVSNMIAPAWRAAFILVTGKDPTSAIASKLLGNSAGVKEGGYEEYRSQALSQILPMTPQEVTNILRSEGGVEKILYAALQFGGESVNYFNYEQAQEKQKTLEAERGIEKKKSSSSKSRSSKPKGNYQFAF